MPFLPILLSKIKLHHVSELGVTCWVGWVCVGVSHPWYYSYPMCADGPDVGLPGAADVDEHLDV